MSESHLIYNYNGFNLPVFVSKENKVWLHGATGCGILELKNPTQVIQRHVSLKDRRQIAVGVGMPAWYVTEPGYYLLVFRSKSEKAEQFQRWVFEDVLPSIRKNKVYISPDATKADVIAAQRMAQPNRTNRS